MAARTRLLQLAVAAVSLSIVALVFTSVWPFPSGEFKVDLPSPSEIEWTFSDGVVHVIAPFSIDNGWIYDVDDLEIYYSVTNGTKHELAESTIAVGDIPAGTITSSELDFEFDLFDQYASGIEWMVFHEDMLYFFLEVSCWYTMKLIQFDATYQVSVPWDALIEGYGISGYSYSAGPPLSVSVSYWLNTSDLLNVLPPAQVTVSYYGDDTLMGRTQTMIQLGGHHEGTITTDLSPILATNNTVLLEIQLADFNMTERRTIPALVQGYGISSYSYSLGPPVSAMTGFWLNTSSLLSGQPPAQVSVSYYGDGILMGEGQTTIPLGGENTGVMTMDITPMLASNYEVVIEFQFCGFTITEHRAATAPPGV
jgi:hypothetical protein